MRDISGEERRRLGAQNLSAQRVAGPRQRQLRCGSVGENHVLARAEPRLRTRGARNAPRPSAATGC